MKKTYILAGVAILFWSSMATVSKMMLGSFSQYQLLCISALFACLGLLGFNLFTGKQIIPYNKNRRPTERRFLWFLLRFAICRRLCYTETNH